MSKLHDIHPKARKLAWIKYAFLDSANNLDAIGGEITRLLGTKPTVKLIGAGMSPDQKNRLWYSSFDRHNKGLTKNLPGLLHLVSSDYR